MILGINHIGIAVLDIEESLKVFKKIFEIVNLHIETVESQKVKIASFNVGNVLIELTEPTAEDSPIMKFIQKKGEGIHHIAFEVDTLVNELTRLRD
ncbi:MAG: VOC family protein, partial [Candidatus Kapaibacteriota bacterium]